MIELPAPTVERMLRAWNGKKPGLIELSAAHPHVDLSAKADTIFDQLTTKFVRGASNCPIERAAMERDKSLLIRQHGQELKEAIGPQDTKRFLGRVIGGTVSTYRQATGLQASVPRTAGMML